MKAGTGLAGELGMRRRDDPAAYDRAWRKKNKEHTNAYHRERHAKRKAEDDAGYGQMKRDASKVARRKRKYGITKEETDALLFKQEGRCSICDRLMGDEWRVDHDHKTGQVRALLCPQCNAGLGMFHEDPEVLASAIAYIKRFRTER